MPSSLQPANTPAPDALDHDTFTAAPTAGAKVPGSRPSDSTTGDQSADRASVLIVEDDPRSARLLAAHLTTAGYRPVVTHSATEAQTAVESAIPDLILCDVCLPGMDGIELTTEFRRDGRTSHVPIALITSSDDSRILARGLEAGADDFLAKPVNALELRTRVRSLLRSKILADELRNRAQSAPAAGDEARPSSSQCETKAIERELPLVVIVEDSPQDCRLLDAHLTDFQFETRTANNAATGLELVRECQPDLILLDLLLPDCNGYEFISTLKNDPAVSHVPILVVSAMSEVQDRVKALELGADDFIVKGFERLEFEARTRRLLRLKRSLDQLNTRCDQALQRAVTDSLTGLYTHGYMQETLEHDLQRAERYGHPYSTIFADIDHFKQINDRYGHAAGDQVLRAVADALRGLMRQADTLVRYGGEEFVALLPDTNGEDATALAERMRSTVAALKLPIAGGPIVRVTMSLGVASYPTDATDGNSLVQLGDAAMYLAKRSGRNRTIGCGSRPGPALNDVCVLLLADEYQPLKDIEALLTAEGCRVLCADNAAVAADIASRRQPEAIVVRADSSGDSGFELCRQLKRNTSTQHLPVLMVTPHDCQAAKQRGIDAGADEFISEPVERVELSTRVRSLVGHKRDMDISEDAEAAVFALAHTVEARDPLSADHMQRVARYAVELGRALCLPPHELKSLERAGRVHDIGKIAIPDSILLKPASLSAEEFAIVRDHPEVGYRLLEPLRAFSGALAAVRYHHERLDGSGYPCGLRGGDVPRLAQILALADVFDALTAKRRYRDAMSRDEAVAVLRDEARSGKHDPQLVELFVTKVVQEGDQRLHDDTNGTADQTSKR